MALAQPFSTISPQVVSFTFADFQSKTGFISYLAGDTVDKNILSNKPFFSEHVWTGFSSSASITTSTLLLDVDFDIEFVQQQIIQGDAIINVPFGWKQTAGNLRTKSAYVIVKIRKWDGSTETEIAQNQGENASHDTAIGTPRTMMDAINVTIPQTVFAEGESLRITIELWGIMGDTPQTATFFIAHDPNGREGGNFDEFNLESGAITTMDGIIPFRPE